MIGRRSFLQLLALVPVAPALSACGDAGPEGEDGGRTPGAGRTEGSAAAPVTEVTIVSVGLDFDVTTIFVPAGKPVTVTYDNRHEGVPHNVHVSGAGLDAKTPVRPGPIMQELVFTAPSAGRFDFICDVHPVTMKGVFQAV